MGRVLTNDVTLLLCNQNHIPTFPPVNVRMSLHYLELGIYGILYGGDIVWTLGKAVVVVKHRLQGRVGYPVTCTYVRRLATELTHAMHHKQTKINRQTDWKINSQQFEEAPRLPLSKASHICVATSQHETKQHSGRILPEPSSPSMWPHPPERGELPEGFSS